MWTILLFINLFISTFKGEEVPELEMERDSSSNHESFSVESTSASSSNSDSEEGLSIDETQFLRVPKISFLHQKNLDLVGMGIAIAKGKGKKKRGQGHNNHQMIQINKDGSASVKIFDISKVLPKQIVQGRSLVRSTDENKVPDLCLFNQGDEYCVYNTEEGKKKRKRNKLNAKMAKWCMYSPDTTYCIMNRE